MTVQPRRFVIEAVMLAVYGQLLVPKRPVEFLIPYSTLMELYEMRDSEDHVMVDQEDDWLAKQQITALITFFENELNQKKINRALSVPWRNSSPLLLQDHVSVVVVNALDNMRYGESFDPIETELVMTSMREQAPLLTDQLEYVAHIIEHEIPVPIYDIEDFEYALEQELPEQDWNTST